MPSDPVAVDPPYRITFIRLPQNVIDIVVITHINQHSLPLPTIATARQLHTERLLEQSLRNGASSQRERRSFLHC